MICLGPQRVQCFVWIVLLAWNSEDSVCYLIVWNLSGDFEGIHTEAGVLNEGFVVVRTAILVYSVACFVVPDIQVEVVVVVVAAAVLQQ